MLNKHLREFLKLLIDNGIRFVVVGGYAVGIRVKGATPSGWNLRESV